MGKWGEKWDDYNTDLSGWNDMAFAGYDFRDKVDNAAWLLLKFDKDGQRASVSMNFFPGTDHAGRAKAHQISMGKLHAFFRAAGLGDDEMPDLDPDAIKGVLDKYDAVGLTVGCRVGKDDKGFHEVKDFRKAK